ncbi:hypothetical protein RSAG8_12916, partial [Rhizoctonia solani AG-8 WAC10335]
MAASLHPHSSNPFRDANRSPTVTPQATGTSTNSSNPFLHPAERVNPQETGASQYFTPQPTGTLSPQATAARLQRQRLPRYKHKLLGHIPRLHLIFEL